jgi:ribonuclease E
MSSKILINAVDAEECRIAKVTDSKLEDFQIETASHQITHGNVYKGVITRIEPSLQAVFVDYGSDRNGFLQKQEIHYDYFQESNNPDRSMHQLVKKGQELLVQVTKDPIGSKGAMLTTFISLAGRYLVLMPGTENRGISRKIEDEEERKRLKDIITGIKVPEGFGLIVRTAGLGCTKTLINNDLNYLLRLWKNIKGKVVTAETPSLMFKERNVVVRSLRDYFTSDIVEILIDDAKVHQEARDFIKLIAPKQAGIVKRYRGAKPIFTKFQLEHQITSIFESRVTLKSGGSIVIEQTEALVSIDVNSGKATKGKDIEETAFETNMEAAEEVARQLRLRDMGGLIVIDFIDMRDNKHRLEVVKTLKKHMKSDKARTRIGRITNFGLLEMSRQRLRPSIDYGRFETCRYCRGKGVIPSADTLGAEFLRKLHLETLAPNMSVAKCMLPIPTAAYVLNKKRREIMEIENRRGIQVIIEGDPDMIPGEAHIALEP